MTLQLDTIVNPFTRGLLDACSAASQPYEPELDVQEIDTGFFIRDRERPIAYIHRRWFLLDAFEFSPFTSLGRDTTISPFYDMGTYINMHATLFCNIQGNHGWPTVGCDIDWQVDGHQISIDIKAQYQTGDRTHNTLTIGYDEFTGQYLYRLHQRVRQPHLKRQEFCNLYPKDMGNGMPEDKKWQYTLWTGPDGNLWKMPHNPAFAMCMRALDPERDKSIAPQGWLGFGVEDDFNLCAVFEYASTSLLSATCDMWFDEHLSFVQPTMEYMVDRDGSEAEVVFRLINAPASFMQRAIADARQVPVSDKEVLEHGGPAFIPGLVNDLESPMDPNEPQAGGVWQMINPKPVHLVLEDQTRRALGKLDPALFVTWADDCGHSGSRSIKLRSLPDRIVYLGATGHGFHTKPDTTYRFDGWIKTGGASARLWLARTWYTSAVTHGEAVSPDVRPNSDWTHVSVEIDSQEYPYLICRLAVEGDGHAWFDDLRFDRVRA